MARRHLPAGGRHEVSQPGLRIGFAKESEEQVQYTLRAERVGLRAIVPPDYQVLYTAELSEFLGVRWRHRGTTPSPERYAQTLWDGVLVQLGVVDLDKPAELIGIVGAYSANLRDGYCYLSVTKLNGTADGLLVLEGLIVLIDYLFMEFGFRKLYAESMGNNFSAFTSGAGKLFEIEGRLTDHRMMGGGYVDEYILAFTRSTWATQARRLRNYIYGGAAPLLSNGEPSG